MGGNTSKVPEIILSISWKGVQFADATTKVRGERGRDKERERETKIEREGGERKGGREGETNLGTGIVQLI